MTEETVTAGREAWERLKDRERKSWADWLLVGEALSVGKTEALRAANTNRAVGSRYNRAIGAWLKDNSLADMTPAERYRILLIMERRVEIEAWRASLGDAQRRRLNHPAAIWSHWSRATGKGKAPRGRTANGGSKRAYAGNRPICFDQEAVRRAGLAMKESRSSDWFRLAAVALHAALRDRGDLLALLAACAPPTASKVAVYVAPQQAAFPTINMPVAIR
jgi:hypothetical protein